MSTVYLLIGTNLGNKEENIKTAVRLLKKVGRIKKHSAIYETEPWGFADDRNFFNMAVCMDTPLNPFELLNEILKIEISIGRKRQEKQWIAREIDIDIIFYDDKIINDEYLVVPHPQLQNRRFVLVPMNEIASRFVHPSFGRSIAALLKECSDDSAVEPLHIPSFDGITPN